MEGKTFCGKYPVMMMERTHPFPYRTRQLSSSMQTIVGRQRPVKICCRRILYEDSVLEGAGFSFFILFLAIFEDIVRSERKVSESYPNDTVWYAGNIPVCCRKRAVKKSNKRKNLHNKSR